jgi:EAL domain-containing protein (putative c-di-GMP-specific phosphodiesterase class I)
MGEWALSKACLEAALWLGGEKAAVNLSPAQFRSKGLDAAVEAALRMSGLQP